jgi:hypothetical protein
MKKGSMIWINKNQLSFGPQILKRLRHLGLLHIVSKGLAHSPQIRDKKFSLDSVRVAETVDFALFIQGRV